MKISFTPTATFERAAKKLKKRYKSLHNDLIAFMNEFIKNPDSGSDLGGGIRKIRVSIRSKGKGKSGGARIITYTILLSMDEKRVFLLTIYDKSETETISESRIIELKNEAENM